MATAPASQRYFPNLKDQVPYHAEVEFRQLRSMIYDLLDARTEIADYFMSASVRVDRNLSPGKFLVVLLRQDATGGWTAQWATNPDGSKKFKGTTGLAITTTANTYSALIFYVTSTTEAMLIAGVTGGDL